MTIQLPYFAAKPSGNTALSISYESGEGYFIAYQTGYFVIDCWGKGGNGANGGASLGGGGGGGGGHSKKIVSLAQGDNIHWAIDSSGNCSVNSSPHAISMTANCGNNAAGNVRGTGGSASGGDINRGGGPGTTATTVEGGRGGNTHEGGVGGKGGTANNDGLPGTAPGAGGGGGGSTSGLGSTGATARITFAISLSDAL